MPRKPTQGRAPVFARWRQEDSADVAPSAASDKMTIHALHPARDDPSRLNIPTPDYHPPAGTPTPLHLAARDGHKPHVMFMVQVHGCRLEARDSNGKTPLHVAAYAGEDEVVDWLLRKGADPSTVDNAGITPLHTAAQRGNVYVLQQLLGMGVDVNLVAGKGGYTALHWAVERCRRIEATKLLIRRGADLERLTADGTSPLMIALLKARGTKEPMRIPFGKGEHLVCHKGGYAACKVLVEAGASIDAVRKICNGGMRIMQQHKLTLACMDKIFKLIAHLEGKDNTGLYVTTGVKLKFEDINDHEHAEK